MPTFIIIGDSQAQANEKSAKLRLLGDGYSFLGLFAKHGAGSNTVYELAKQAKLATSNPDLILVFSGSTENGIIAGREIPKLFSNAKIIWFGSAPATKIKDLTLARNVFGTKVIGDDYWHECGEDQNRENRNKKLKEYFKNSKVIYVDYRDLSLKNKVTQKSGISFPNLQDGIHITNEVSKEIFNSVNFPPRNESSKGFSVVSILSSLALVSLTVLMLLKFNK